MTASPLGNETQAIGYRSPGSPIVRASSLVKTFGGITALDHVQLTCWPGEIHALVGENGAGKSTLIQILSGVYTPDSGEVLVQGEPQHFSSPADAERAGIVAVYQELSLVEQLDVAQNVYLHREPRLFGPFLDPRRLYADCATLLASLGIRGISPRARVDRLSVADRQLVELARALSRDAAFIIMDEPTSALSTADQDRLFGILADLRGAGRGVLYVTHRLNEVFAVADRVTVLRDGRLVATKPISATSHRDLVQLMVGRDLAHHMFPARPSQPAASPPALEVDGLSSPGLLDDVSLVVRPGEIVGLAGLIGSGRTSLLKAIFGADPLATGSIRLGGQSVRIRSPREAVAQRIAMVSEDRRLESLALRIDVLRNATAVRLPAHAGLVDWRGSEVLARTATSSVGLRGDLRRPVRELSGGNQQKVAIAKWLVDAPRLILCDEPTRGIDVGAKAEIYALLRRLADDGAAVLFASSELPEVLGLGERLLVMYEGSIVAEFGWREADEASIMRAASGLD